MRILLPSLLGVCLFGAACTPTAGELQARADRDAGNRAALDTALAGFTPGRPQACIEQTRLRGSQTFGDAVVYDGAGSVRYLNVTSGGCSQAGNQGFIVTRTPSTSLCRGDIARVIDRTSRIEIGACSFGDFVPYSRAQ